MIASQFIVLSRNGSLHERDVFPDRVHPNNDGAAILASTVYATLKGKPYAGLSVIAQVPATTRAASASGPAR